MFYKINKFYVFQTKVKYLKKSYNKQEIKINLT